MGLNSNWTIIYDNDSATFLLSLVWCGQLSALGMYEIHRSFLIFDTSFLPDDANITGAILSLYLHQNSTTQDFNITLQKGSGDYPHFPTELGDYNRLYYSGDGGTFNTTNIQTERNNITLNNDGISWINLVGLTKFCLRSDREINGITPTDSEYIGFKGPESSEATKPILYLNYSYVYTEQPSGSSGDTENGEPTTIIDIPEITVPQFHIPIWGYYVILGSVAIVAFASILSKPPRSKHGPNGTKIKRTQKRLPKRNKRTGRFQ